MIASNEQIVNGINEGFADIGQRSINCKIGLMVDGEFKEIGQPINPIELTIDEAEIDEVEIDAEKICRSFEFVMKMAEKERRKIIRAIFGNAFSNNYRKMHGLPMRRRVGK